MFGFSCVYWVFTFILVPHTHSFVSYNFQFSFFLFFAAAAAGSPFATGNWSRESAKYWMKWRTENVFLCRNWFVWWILKEEFTGCRWREPRAASKYGIEREKLERYSTNWRDKKKTEEIQLQLLTRFYQFYAHTFMVRPTKRDSPLYLFLSLSMVSFQKHALTHIRDTTSKWDSQLNDIRCTTVAATSTTTTLLVQLKWIHVLHRRAFVFHFVNLFS